MLQQSARECLLRLRKAEEGKAGIEESQLLNALHDELMVAAKRLHEAAIKATVLADAGIQIGVPSGLTKHQQAIAGVAERFREASVGTTLKQGKRWPTLLATVAEAARASDAALTEAWKLYIASSLFAGPTPEEEERTMARTPKNQKAMEVYRQLFGRFAFLRSSVPASAQAIKDLKKLSSELAAIEFDRNVPAAIKRFLDAIATTTGAGLALLTDEVREWLINHDLFERYVIRSKVD